MARYIAGIQGSRGLATRLGGLDSGIRAYARGWNLGIEVYGRAAEDGSDQFTVYASGGSNDPSSRREIGSVRLWQPVADLPSFAHMWLPWTGGIGITDPASAASVEEALAASLGKPTS
jgi:hypothetical protein